MATQTPIPPPDRADGPERLLQPTPDGLYCAAGGFHVDPWRPVERAVVTHAHADHAVRGCASYLTSAQGLPVLEARVGGPEASDAIFESLANGEQRRIGDVLVSFHPAGHITGSVQVRLERDGYVEVFTGDYRTPDAREDAHANATCEPFEPVRCHTFITESTFGLAIYRWPDPSGVFADMNAWWVANAAAGRTSVVFANALGKAQRVLTGIDPSIGPIGVHGAVESMNEACARAGVRLPETVHVNADTAPQLRGKGLVIMPPSASDPKYLRRLGPVSTAMVSGWMLVRGARRWRSMDRGFAISDHCDFPGLIDAIRATGAERVGLTHGFTEPMARWVCEQMGLDAFVVPTRFTGDEEAGSAGANGNADVDDVEAAGPEGDDA